nr:MAG TPA: hypothetical protein [Caudoviricetes sp.]
MAIRQRVFLILRDLFGGVKIMTDIQKKMWDALCKMSGEDVARLFVNWCGEQILDNDFYKNMVDEGEIEDEE